ncbi:MAG: hypothetical protein JRI68_25675 [Deltaproteobacteria bacterium]|nr:hypothetical protein [Deltaproteobacteria bacterium]
MSSEREVAQTPPQGDEGPAANPQAASMARAALVSRLFVAHMVCYPMMSVAAAAGMSLSIIANDEALLQAGAITSPATAVQCWLMAEVGLDVVEAASLEIIMEPVLVVLLVVFVIVHAGSVPWALAARRAALTDDWGGATVRRARLRWAVASLGSTLLVVVAGLVGWLVILLS